MTPVKTVDVYTCREILRIRSGVEQCPAPDEPGEYYWAELLRECAEADALDATWAHYRTSSRPLMPADILERVGRIAAARTLAAAGARDRSLLERAFLGWDPDRLVRWRSEFDTEVARGASVDDACAVADADAGERSYATAATGAAVDAGA